MDDLDKMRQDCWNQAVYSWGTAWIFEQRSKRLRRRLRLINFLGIAVPTAGGALFWLFSAASRYRPHVSVVAGVLGLVQLIASIWALVADWQDALVYAQESTADNYRMAREYERLGREPPSKGDELKLKRELLEKEYELRDRSDRQRGLSEAEKRAGTRAALRNYQRKCAGCGEVPKSLRPSECEVCGSFAEWRIRW